MGVVKSLFGAKDPAPPVAAPAPPTPAQADPEANTTQAVVDQAQPTAGRSANVSAGAGDPSLDDSTDPYSVRKKLLGA